MMRCVTPDTDTIQWIRIGCIIIGSKTGIGAQIIRDMGVAKMKLMSNNPKKRSGLVGYGLEIVDNVALEIASNEHNDLYLKTKRDKMGHTLKMDK